MTSTHKRENPYWPFLRQPLVVMMILIGLITLIGFVASLLPVSRISPEEQKRQDFVDGCKYYSNGAPDTSTVPWRCIK